MLPHEKNKSRAALNFLNARLVVVVVVIKQSCHSSSAVPHLALVRHAHPLLGLLGQPRAALALVRVLGQSLELVLDSLAALRRELGAPVVHRLDDALARAAAVPLLLLFWVCFERCLCVCVCVCPRGLRAPASIRRTAPLSPS